VASQAGCIRRVAKNTTPPVGVTTTARKLGDASSERFIETKRFQSNSGQLGLKALMEHFDLASHYLMTV
jgi:hypothetical protein